MPLPLAVCRGAAPAARSAACSAAVAVGTALTPARRSLTTTPAAIKAARGIPLPRIKRVLEPPQPWIERLAAQREANASATDAAHLDVPENVAPAFYHGYVAQLRALGRGDGDAPALRTLMTQLHTHAEAALFAVLLREWHRAARPWSRVDSAILTEQLADVQPHLADALVAMWQDKYTHHLHVEGSRLEQFLTAQVADILDRAAQPTAPGTEDDAPDAAAEHVYGLYRTYALFLYYDVAPTAAVYDALIVGAAGSRWSGGRVLAERTLAEMRSLGLTPSAAALAHLAYARYLDFHRGDATGPATLPAPLDVDGTQPIPTAPLLVKGVAAATRETALQAVQEIESRHGIALPALDTLLRHDTHLAADAAASHGPALAIERELQGSSAWLNHHL